ncbi:hypothetical protein RB213_010396 [Colletotrichum asianum]
MCAQSNHGQNRGRE